MSAILELPSTLLLVFAVVGLVVCLLGLGLAVSVVHSAVVDWLQARHERADARDELHRLIVRTQPLGPGWEELPPSKRRPPDADVKAQIIERLKDPRRRRGLR